MLSNFKEVINFHVPGNGIPEKDKAVYNPRIFSETPVTLTVKILRAKPRIDIQTQNWEKDGAKGQIAKQNADNSLAIYSVRYLCEFTNPANNVTSQGFIHACDVPGLVNTNGVLTMTAKMSQPKLGSDNKPIDSVVHWITFRPTSGTIQDGEQLKQWFAANEAKIFANVAQTVDMDA